MEIIVLDDSSVDNTSILIKSFAHAGVRFVESEPLPQGWLGKNHALNELLDEASGSYIVFLDVDTHITPYSIESLMSYALHEQADMISVLPMRSQNWRASSLFSTLRHFWLLVTHAKHRPAVTSSAWMVKREALRESVAYKDLTALRQEVRPEFALAKFFASKNSYRFVASNAILGISYEKRWRSQLETSIRLYYPVLAHSVLRTVGASVGLIGMLLPFIILGVSLVVELPLIVSLSALIGAILMVVVYGVYLFTTWRRWWYVGMLMMPYTTLQEAILFAASVVQYRTKRVTWKGRPIYHTVAGSKK